MLMKLFVMNQSNQAQLAPGSVPLFDKKAFRLALGNFATGVTVVTSCDVDGGWVGITANSFNSVSLDPPLILWSLNRRAWSLPVFEQAGYFIVNVLADDQLDLSNRFATQGKLDKFAGVSAYEGIGGAPVLTGCTGSFQCEKRFTYDGGDHLIFVGEVIDFASTDKPGLLYHRGQYAVSQPHPEIGAR